MLPRKIFENLRAVMASLVSFTQLFSRKFGLNILTLVLSASRNMTLFFLTFSIMRA